MTGELVCAKTFSAVLLGSGRSQRYLFRDNRSQIVPVGNSGGPLGLLGSSSADHSRNE